MGNLFYLRGMQIVFTFLLIFRNGQRDQFVVKVGPFGTKNSFLSWRNKFLEVFREGCTEEEEIVGCIKVSERPQPFDPGDLSVFRPQEQEYMCGEIIDAVVFSNSKEYLDEPHEYIFWDVMVRFDFRANPSFFVTEVRFGPFVSMNNCSAWWSKFVRGVRTRASRIKGVKFKTLKKTVIKSVSPEFDACNDDVDIVCEIMDCLNPRTEGEIFCSESVQDWLLVKNGSFQL
jgi:hypothetical protein